MAARNGPNGQHDTRPVAVLGLGRFGQRLATRLTAAGEDVIAIDHDRAIVDQTAPHVTQAIVADITDEPALRAVGLHKVKVGVVSIGDDFEAAVLAAVILKQMQVPRIIARARSGRRAEVLRRIGADEIVLPEDEAADRWSARILGPRVLSQIEFHEGYSIVEFTLPASWVGKSLAEIEVRAKYGLHVVAVRRLVAGEDDRRIVVPGPSEPMQEGDVLILMGKDEQLAALSKLHG